MIPVELVGVFDNAGNLVSLAPKTGKPGPKTFKPAMAVTGPNGEVFFGDGTNNWSPQGLVPAGLTTSHIIDAMNYVAARGGGVVQLQPDTYTYTASIPVISGVQVIGSQLSWTFTGDVPDTGWTYSEGTRILGTGTETAFYGNNVDAGSVNPAGFATDAISGFGLKDIVFENFANAIDVGAVNKMGLYNALFERIFLINSGWNLENFQQCIFRTIYANVNRTVVSSGRSIRFASSVPIATLVPGDSIIENFFRRTNGVYHDSVMFEALAGCSLNNIIARRMHVNRYDTGEFSATATFDSTANISVPDSSLWPVGLPVMFKSTVAGFTANYIYFVLTSSANVITLGTYPGATAQTANASTTGTMYSGGFPNYQFLGRVTGGGLANGRFSVTAEADAAVGIVGLNLTGYDIEVTDVLPNQHQHVVLRTAIQSSIRALTTNLKTDFDNGSSTVHFTGRRGTITNRTGWGAWNGHFYGSPAVSIASGAANGVGGTAALSQACDSQGVITITPSGTPSAGVVATITFGMAKEQGMVSLIPINAAANALQITANAVRMQDPPRTTGFDIVTDGALTAASVYKFAFMSI